MTFFFADPFPVGKRDEREEERVVMSLIRKKYQFQNVQQIVSVDR